MQRCAELQHVHRQIGVTTTTSQTLATFAVWSENSRMLSIPLCVCVCVCGGAVCVCGVQCVCSVCVCGVCEHVFPCLIETQRNCTRQR